MRRRSASLTIDKVVRTIVTAEPTSEHNITVTDTTPYIKLTIFTAVGIHLMKFQKSVNV